MADKMVTKMPADIGKVYHLQKIVNFNIYFIKYTTHIYIDDIVSDMLPRTIFHKNLRVAKCFYSL